MNDLVKDMKTLKIIKFNFKKLKSLYGDYISYIELKTVTRYYYLDRDLKRHLNRMKICLTRNYIIRT